MNKKKRNTKADSANLLLTNVLKHTGISFPSLSFAKADNGKLIYLLCVSLVLACSFTDLQSHTHVDIIFTVYCMHPVNRLFKFSSTSNVSHINCECTLIFLYNTDPWFRRIKEIRKMQSISSLKTELYG